MKPQTGRLTEAVGLILNLSEGGALQLFRREPACCL